MNRLLLTGVLLLAGCGVDGPPLRPDGTPVTEIEDWDRDRTVSTSPRWDNGQHDPRPYYREGFPPSDDSRDRAGEDLSAAPVIIPRR